jgi:hypothetical protein
MVRSASDIGMIGWERVSLVATAALVFQLTSAAHATAQPRGYAAVAVDGRGAWGASLGLVTANAAGRDAIRRCGSNCRVVMTGRGRCVAFADTPRGGYWYGHSYGDSPVAVRRIAMQGCSSGAPAGTCRIKHVNCLAQRID